MLGSTKELIYIKIKVKNLQTYLNCIISYLNNLNINEIDIIEDYYLNIDNIDKFDFDKVALTLTKIKNNVSISGLFNVGSIIDDLEEINKSIEDPCRISCETINELGNLLLYISYYIDTTI